MESVLVLLRVLCVVFFCAVAVRACGTNNAVCEEARRTLVDSACEIRGNELVLADYYSGVRARHSEFGANYFAIVHFGLSKLLRCRKVCSGATADNITWCINIWNHDEEVELCVSTAGFTNISSMAETARISEHFNMPENCLDPATGIDYRTGCLEFKKPEYYLNNAYLTCTSETETCVKTSFYRVEVSVNGYDSEPPTLARSWSETEQYQLTLGETAYLECSVILKGLSQFSGWYQDGHHFEHVIIDPSCNPMKEDCMNSTHFHPSNEEILSRRKHVFQSSEVFRNCPTTEVVITNYLEIVNVTESDAGVYTCNATVVTLVPVNHVEYGLWNITAITVPPEREPYLQEFPQSSLYTIPRGASVNWTVVLVAGSYDDVLWLFGDSPAEIVDTPPDCVNQTDINFFATVTEGYVVNYTRQFWTTVHICNARVNNTGIYSLVVQSWKAKRHTVVSFQVDVEDPSDGHVREDGSGIILYTVIPVVAVILLVTGFVVVFLLLFMLRKSYKKDAVARIFTQEEHGIPGDYLKKETTVKLLSVDPMEFPRAKLHIMKNLLGEGTFGKVLQAKAEGIVAGAPRRNIVAVKTTKDNPTSQETQELWDELLLMKHMEPHENILNLLGHCSTSGGPLYLIIEYAMYGSLKDFLRQCEEAVRSLNHMPVIVRSNSRTRSTSCSSCSSAYPLIVNDKPPLSAQNSVFLAGTPSGQSSFVFPQSQRQRLQTQDSGCFTDHEESSLSAAHIPAALPLAHAVCPLTHDYINTKGLIHMEDVQNFALQIACGLQHLENMQIVHCDLAARNILIAEGFVLKIADFGMAREVGEKAYYRKSPKGRIPVKWTAPEALESHLFTYRSDVWSFGVLLWEIFAYGRSPYHEISIRSWEPFITYLEEGNRLPMPEGCPDSFYNIMLQCWNLRPDERPTASELVATFNPEAEELSGSDYTGSTVPVDGTAI